MTAPLDPAPADRTTEHPEAVAPTGDALRAILRAVASPVVVVTVSVDGETRGATIGSFASVSLSPPLVSFNVTHGTRLHDALDAADAFAVHLLAADQAALASHFARPDLDAESQMAGAAPVDADGPLRLAGTLGTLACTVAARVQAGDHTVVIGEVTDLVPGRDAAPLLYYRQSYRGIGAEV
ncbi:MAG TPA: flavin reductase family protein [Rubricoccaceae bacterium]|jgi:flavin reductase (DIM6/NTAB) family NADH-FMN oxidoreductase RutF